MYDWLAHRNLQWPSSSARWGPVLQRCADKVVQRLFYCERTGETDYLNTLVLAKAHVPYGGLSDRQTLGRFSNRGGNSGKLQTEKRILHPGEVNALRLCHQREGLVCTHSDTSAVYVWDTDAAPHAVQNKRRKTGEGSKECPKPTATLVGHEKMAQYAIDTARKAPYVVSGGQDHLVLLWSLDDLSTAQQWSPGGETRMGPVLYPRSKFYGHTDTVEAVACHPTNIDECCSGGDDKLLLFWDCRQQGHKPAAKVEGLHFNDINCLGWNTVATELVATGDSDGIIRVFDTRSLGSPLHTIAAGSEGYGWLSSTNADNPPGHVGSVMTVEWMPHSSTILASGGDDCALRVWDIAEKVADGDGLLPVFAHAGHRHPVVDIDWNEHSPGTLVSLSEPTDGGSKLQMWRISETIAEAWPLKEGTAIGSIETGNMPENIDRLNLPPVALPLKRRCNAGTSVAKPKAETGESEGLGRRPMTRRTSVGEASTDGGGSGQVRSGLTVVNAALAAMREDDPDNQGMELRAILTAVERNHPGKWTVKSVQNMLTVAARKGDRLMAGDGRGAAMLVTRAEIGDELGSVVDVAEPGVPKFKTTPGGERDNSTRTAVEDD
jgi:histone-binding protein RBBP4